MGKTHASNAKNQDTSHDTAQTSSAMNVMNSDTSSWTALTECPLQGHQCHTTRHTEITTTDLPLGTTGKTKKEKTSPDHSLDTANILAPAIMTCTEDAPNCNNGTAQDDPIQHSEDTATGPTMTHNTGHTANPLHTTVHQVTALRIVVDYIHDHPTTCRSIVHTKKDHTFQDDTPTRETKSPT